MPIIALKNVSKAITYGHLKQNILLNINLEIESGDFVAIIGRSGSGKSTLLNILGCLDSNFSGEYSLNNENIKTFKPEELAERRCRYLGFVFQRYNLLPTLNSLNNVELPAIYAGESRNNRIARASTLLQKFDLESKLNSMPRELSGGEQQRISIARALMNSGNIILADEPTGSLDTQNTTAVMGILKEQNQEGKTVILVTHDQAVASYANRIIEIQDGRITLESKNVCVQDIASHRPTPQIIAYKNSPVNLLFETIIMAIMSIKEKKLRSSLTTLGVVVGIAAVLFVMALGQGAKEKIVSDINKMGSNTIDVYPGQDFGDVEAWRLNSLSLVDVENLKKIDFISGVSPSSTIEGNLVRNNITRNVLLTGVDNNYFFIKNLSKEQGRFLSIKDSQSASSAAVINQGVKNAFFSDTKDAIGSIILFNGTPFVVVGTLKDNRLQPDVKNGLKIFVPYSTLKHKIANNVRIQSMAIAVKEGVNPQAAETAINALLLRTHGGKNDFFTSNSNTLQLALEQATQTMTLSATCIALVSLFVGGIGVANIMLVSITERIQEIGLRLAVGARRGDILRQFLLESVILCFFGGCFGCSLAIILSFIFEKSIPDISLSYTYHGFIAAFGCSIALGILAGTMPAYFASRLNPATALTRE